MTKQHIRFGKLDSRTPAGRYESPARARGTIHVSTDSDEPRPRPRQVPERERLWRPGEAF